MSLREALPMHSALVLGAGDVGSAVAHALHLAGWQVLIVDRPNPSWHRRGMAYVDAAYGRAVSLDGVGAMPASTIGALRGCLARREHIAVTAGPSPEEVIGALDFALVVDARMRKREPAQRLWALTPLTVGLGPGFVAGEHVHVVVETAWGEDLGRPLRYGSARAQSGEPRPIMGIGRARCVYAPRSGTFRALLEVGEPVMAGSRFGFIDGEPLDAPLSGVVRGISASGAQLHAGAKIFEVDPRGDPRRCFGVSERPRRIAQGVLQAVAASECLAHA